MPPERRSHSRGPTKERGIISVYVRPGFEAAAVNVSDGGVLIDTARRLLPGAPVDLHIQTAQRLLPITGRVVRCTVIRVRASAVCYRAAIAFDAPYPWGSEKSSGGNGVPARESNVPPIRG